MIRRLGLWGGCQGRGKSLRSLIPKPQTHPYLQLDSQGSQDLGSNLAGEQAAGHRRPRTVGCLGSLSLPIVGVVAQCQMLVAAGMGSKCFRRWPGAPQNQTKHLPRRQCGAKCSILGTRPAERGLSETPRSKLESQRAKWAASLPQPVRHPLVAPHPATDWIWPFLAFDTDMVSLPGIRASISLFYF